MKNDIIWSCNLVLLLLKKRTLLNKIQAMNLNRSAFINFQQTDCRRKFDKLFSRNLSSFLLHLRKVPTSFKRGLQAQRPPLPIDFWQSKGPLISKATYGLLTSPKKGMDKFAFLAFLLFKANWSNCFLGESTARQFASRFYLTFSCGRTWVSPYAASTLQPLLVGFQLW